MKKIIIISIFLISTKSIIAQSNSIKSSSSIRVEMLFPEGKSKSLILSFDDGTISDRRLVQLMNNYELKGTFHLNSNKLDTKDYLTTLTKKLKSVKPNNQLFKINSNIKSLLNFEAYDLMVNKILSFIKEGDVYQINISNKYIVSCEGNSWTGYKKLREINRAPFMAYFHFDDFDILCGSPERFIQSHSKRVETRPIRGTEPRDINPIKDKEKGIKGSIFFSFK